MTHKDKGRYHAKHPSNATVPEELRSAIEEKSRAQAITCAAAHAIAHDLKFASIKVGKAIDLMEYHIHKCQLGLFGYSPEKKIVTPIPNLSSDLEKRIRLHLQEGRLPCATAWQLAEDCGLSRLELCSICEALKIKIFLCQLGVF